MRTLFIENFSCVQNAEIELKRLTVIIGPQASGKSVVSKLCYFLFDCAHHQQISIQRRQSFEKYVSVLKAKFIEWFPTEAWGSKRFRIELSAGNYSITLTRKTYGGKVSEDFRIKFSDAFKAQYQALLDSVENSTKTSREEIALGLDYRVFEQSRKSLAGLMGKDNIAHQAFVPAGRSFFTSIGKAIAAFEQGRVLDPLILQFGRLYTAYRENDFGHYYGEKPAETSIRKALERQFDELLGGKVEKDGEREYLRTQDDRKVPLSAMSSGQQELLPLASMLPWLTRGRDDRLCYIEEPEAHLFPKAQSQLIETLVQSTSVGSFSTNLVMTTHSPYVLTKINNLLRAGALSRRLTEEKRKVLEAIIPKRAWLSVRNVSAYAIQDGTLGSILESDGLISSDYLDEVSSEMSLEFGKLLELEESVV